MHSTRSKALGKEYAEDVLQGKISGTFAPVIGRKKAPKAEGRRVAFIIYIQQKYVLTLLAQGYKNAEIVEMTGLTLNTIRAHAKMVYQKLDVNKAADAVMEAKRLGIIES